MHPNPIYRDTPRARNLDFARDRGFGILAVADGSAPPMLSHVPFLLGGTEDAPVADLHLVRSNPIARALGAGPRPARLAVSGPDGYISPDWYGMPDQVPTWNYVAVHLSGRLELRPEAELPGLLDRLSERFEARLDPKPRWSAAKMDRDALARMLRMILPCRLRVETVDGTWKLSQNKPEPARQGAADGLADTPPEAGLGQELAALAALMRAIRDRP